MTEQSTTPKGDPRLAFGVVFSFKYPQHATLDFSHSGCTIYF